MGVTRNLTRGRKSIFQPVQFGFFCALLCAGLCAAAFFTPGQTAWAARTANGARALAGRLGLPLNPAALFAATVTGTVYVDYNQNGVFDTTGTAPNFAVDSGAGLNNVVVTAYDARGVSVGTATTNASGFYSLSVPGTATYRLEFTALPSGYYPSAVGTNNATTVRFITVTDLTTTNNIDLGLSLPADYAPNDPELITNCYVYGNQGSTSNPDVANDPVLVSFPYSAGSSDSTSTATSAIPQYDAPAAHSLMVPAQTVGTTFGLAYARAARRLYAAAFFKRHSGFGKGRGTTGLNGTIDTSNGTSTTGDDQAAIYQINRDTGALVNTFTVPGALLNAHDTSNYQRDNDSAGWNAVGKYALGGLDISPDETTLYVMNLENRTLYALNATTGAVITSQAVPTSGVPTPGGTASTAAAGDVRPFAVRYYRGKLYVGLVTTGESGNSTTNTNDLFAHVYEVNATTLAFTTPPILSFALNYARGKASTATGANSGWRPWRPMFTNLTGEAGRVTYAQAMFTDLTFDNGAMIIGLRDRLGDQIGNGTQSNSSATLNQPRTAGEILRACVVSGSWTLESNGRCGSPAVGSGPQDTGQGPGATTTAGSGEYYFGDSFDLANGTPAVLGIGSRHDETGMGGLGQLPGALDVVMTIFDPIPNIDDGTLTVFDGGMRWLRNAGANAGAFSRAYRLYDGASNDTATAGTAGKANGLGEIELLADPAPLQLGNRVWQDTNGNGVQDPGENGISGVTVDLYQGGTRIGTATTDANGNYLFGGAANAGMLNNASCTGTITRRVANLTDDAEQAGVGVTATTNGSPLSLAAGTTNNIVGVRFVGVAIPKGATITAATIQFTPTATPGSGTVNVFVDGELSANPNTFAAALNDLSGRTKTSVGNRVSWSPAAWTASTADANSTTPSLTAIVQEIVNLSGWQNGNALSFIISNNGTTGTNARNAQDLDSSAATALLTVTYTCPYTLAPATAYEIRIPNASGGSKQAALGTNNLTTANTDPSANGDARDSDATMPSTTALVAVTTGVYGENNHSYDFGFVPAATTISYSVGNRVWRDNGAGGGTANDGIMNGTEAGISGVTVELVDSSGNSLPTPRTTTTDASGYYRFDSVAAGTYRVRINPGNFGSGGALQNLYSSAGSSSSNDQRDRGVDPANVAAYTTTGVLSATFTLGPALQPLAEPDFTASGNGAHGTNGDVSDILQLDFGFQPNAPLAVKLSGFTAHANDSALNTRRVAEGEQAPVGGVTIRWRTGLETGNLGFNLYRDEGGARARVNPSLIAGSALLAGTETLLTAGNSYAWHDPRGAAGASYWLEALDVDGSRVWHGPVYAGGQAPDAPDGTLEFRPAPLLEELNNTPNRTPQREYAASGDGSPASIFARPTNKPEGKPDGKPDNRPTPPWTLPNEQAAKLPVRKAGWYRVTATELQAIGFNTRVNAGALQLFADGVEVPIKVSGKGNGFDFIEFYGEGLDTPTTDTRVYWLTAGQSGRRLNTQPAPPPGSLPADSFPATVERKDKLIYFSGLLNGDAENWFGPVITSGGVTQQLTLRAPGAQGSAWLEVTLQGVTEQPHAVSVEVNGRAVGTVNFASRERKTATFPVPLEALRAGDNDIRYVAVAGGSDVNLSESVRLTYPRGFVADNDALQFSLLAGQSARIGGFTTPDIRVLELGAALGEARELTVKAEGAAGNYSIALQSAAGATYLALADPPTGTPAGTRLAPVAGATLNQPSNWRAVTNAADFVIVTHRGFWTAANRLAQARRSQEIRVAVVDVADAYDEFSFGAKSTQAVKDLLSYARANWLVKPRFALFLGDATYDPRNYLGAGDYDFVPTKLGATYYFETALDNWFADANDDSVPEIALGRLPVRTAAQADALVGKILAFKLPVTPRSSLFVSDRTVDGVNFKAMGEQLAGLLPPLMPKQFVNRDDGPPEQVRTQIIGNINQAAPLLVNWLGHGSTQVWTGDGLLRSQDAAVLTNAAPGLFVMTTCLNGFFTDPNLTSLSEAVLLDTPGGAFAAISSSGLNQASSQNVFNLTLFQCLFTQGLTLGEAMTAARVAAVDVDVRNTYVLFGDPTLRVGARR